MSNPIEERIVSVKFEAQDFIKNITKAEKNVDSLSDSVTEFGRNKGFKNAEDSVDSLSAKFSTLQLVVANSLSSIVTNSINGLSKFVKSLTTDNIMAGYTKYEQKTNTMQTLISATRKELDTEEEAMERVNAQLEKMMWYSDESSANFSDMVSSVGMFTSKGIDLEKSTDAIIGISNWGYTLGRTNAEMQRVMLNMSQALGSYVKVQDWMSVENANMDDAKFKQLAIDTAKELGELSETSNVTISNFRETLQQGWFTPEVLMATLDKYGSLTGKIREWTDDLGITASDFLSATDLYTKTVTEGMTDEEKTKAIEKIIEELRLEGVNAEELAKNLSEATKEENKLGLTAFKNAQRALTFSQAIQAIKDASATKFMDMFNTAFGDFLQTRDMWTRLSERLYTIFIEPLNDIIDVMKDWAEMEDGGQNTLVDSVWNIVDAIESLVDAARDVFAEFFDPITAENISSVVLKFKEWTEALKSKDWSTFKDILRVIFSTVTMTGKLLKSTIALTKTLFAIAKPLLDFLVDSLVKTTDKIVNLFSVLTTSFSEGSVDGESSFIKFLRKTLDLGLELSLLIIDTLKPMVDWIGTKLDNFIDTFTTALKDVNWGTIVKNIAGITAVVVAIVGLIRFLKIGRALVGGIAHASEFIASITDVMSSITYALYGKALAQFATSIAALTVAVGFLSKIDPARLSRALGTFVVIVGLIVGSFALITASLKNRGTGLWSIGKDTVKITQLVATMQSFAAIFLQFVGSFILIAAALSIMSIAVRSWKSVGIIATSLALVGGLFVGLIALSKKYFSKAKDLTIFKRTNEALLQFSKSLVAISGSLVAFAIAAFAIKKAVGGIEGFGDSVVSMVFALSSIAMISAICEKIKINALNMKLPLFVTVISGSLIMFALAMRTVRSLIGGTDEFLDNIAALGVGITAIGAMGLVAKAFDAVSFWALLKAFASVGILAAGMMLLLYPAQEFAKIAWKDLFKGFSLFAAGLAIMMAASALTGIPIIAEGLIILTVALIGISAALLLGSKGFTAISESFKVAGEGLKVLSEGMLDIASAASIFDNLSDTGFFKLLLKGLAFGLAMMLMAKPLASIASSMVIVCDAMERLSDISQTEINAMGDKITGFIDAFKEGVLSFIMFIPTLIAGFWAAMAENIPEIVKNFADYIVKLLDALGKNRSRILDALNDFIVKLLDDFGKYASLAQNLFDLLMTVLETVADLFENNKERITDVLSKILQVVVDVLITLVPGLVKTIADLLPELVGGLVGGIYAALFNDDKTGQQITDWITENFRKSPVQAAFDEWINNRKKDFAKLCAGIEFVTSFGSKPYGAILNDYYKEFGVTGVGTGSTTHTSSSGTVHGGGGWSETLQSTSAVNVPNVSTTPKISDYYKDTNSGVKAGDVTNNDYNVVVNVTGNSDPQTTAEMVIEKLNRQVFRQQALKGQTAQYLYAP